MQSWSICRDSSNESVYGQGGAQEEREAFQLEDPSVLAIKGLEQFREFHILSEFRGLLENWHMTVNASEFSEFGFGFAVTGQLVHCRTATISPFPSCLHKWPYFSCPSLLENLLTEKFELSSDQSLSFCSSHMRLAELSLACLMESNRAEKA